MDESPREGRNGSSLDVSLPLGPEADPGYLRTVAEGNVLGSLRLVAATVTGVLPVLLVVLLFTAGASAAWSPLVLLPALLGAGAVAAAVAVPVRPISPDATAEEAARTSVRRFQQIVMLRLALCEIPALFGFVAAFALDGGVIAFLLGAAVTLAGMFRLVIPTMAVVERFRERLEGTGATSYLWNGLLHLRQGAGLR